MEKNLYGFKSKNNMKKKMIVSWIYIHLLFLWWADTYQKWTMKQQISPNKLDTFGDILLPLEEMVFTFNSHRIELRKLLLINTQIFVFMCIY